MRCLFCDSTVLRTKKGLCVRCYRDKGIRLLEKATEEEDEPTEDEIERMIEEQMKVLPVWWEDDVRKQRQESSISWRWKEDD